MKDIDRVFAQYVDGEICSAWAHVLVELIEKNGDQILDKWVESWRIAWAVVVYVGLWEGEGIRSLWLSDKYHMELLKEGLKKINAQHASNFIDRSFDDLDREKSMNANGFEDEAYVKLAEFWDRDLLFYTSDLMEYLAKYLREHRDEVGSIFNAFQAKLHE